MQDRVIDWQQSLREAYRTPGALLQDLDISPDRVDALPDNALDFPLRVPRGFVRRMRRGDPNDPLLKQVLPLQAEQRVQAGFVADPLQEAQAQPTPGLIHKYAGRALLITTGACAVHCRYCFRREFPYAQAHAGRDEWKAALDHLRSDSSIHEVILSGGDPLSLSDQKFATLLEQLDAVPHLDTLRIHTRQPIVLPERITRTLTTALHRSRLHKVVVLHSNHANEIDDEVGHALQQLRESNTILLNQSVLLAGINDDPQQLAKLSTRLFDHQVLPYYLHMLDAVQGAAHFFVEEARAHGIMQQLNARLPGYLVPRLVREIPGADAKMPVPWTAPDIVSSTC